MAKIDLRNARPTVEKLPDGRQRATFAYTVREWVGRTQAEITAEIWAAWGTVAPGDFTALRLVKQTLQGLEPDKTGGLPLLRVFEEIPESAEVQVGEDTITYDETGGKTIVAEFLQFSSATYAPGTIGTMTAPGDATLYLQNADAQDDGTLRRIKRTYVDAGTISTTDETRNNGALLLRTITSVKTAPATPSGYTLVSTAEKNPDGVPVYTYTFAKGTGQVSREDGTSNNGALLTASIRYLTVPGTLGTAGTNPITTPSGYTLVSETYQEADGHRVWSASYAKGTGRISREDTQRNNGYLLIATIRYISVPGTLGTGGISPITAPSGYTLVSESYQEADGHRIWSANYAKGLGEISRDIDYSQSSDQGVTGLTRTTIRYLVAPAGTIQPTTLAGSVLVGQSVSEADGHRVWTTVWAKGTGTIATEVETKEGGALKVYRRTALGAAPTAPTATIGGTVTAISTNVRNQDGFDIYSYAWAEGFGTTTADTDAREDGSLVYNATVIAAAASTPADPGGVRTWYLVKLSTNQADGYVVTRATYISPPATYTRPIQVEFHRPGLVTVGNPPSLTPPVTLDIMGTETVTFSTTQTSATPFQITSWASLYETYTRASDGITYSKIEPLSNYVGAGTASAGATTYRGIPVTSYVLTVGGSSISVLPTGVQTISVRCEKYLTDTSGVTVWRNAVVTATVG